MPADRPTIDELAARLSAWPAPVYVTLDGAKYPDLPALLAQKDIAPRSLFRNQRDSAMVRAGPFFAALDSARLKFLLEIEKIQDASVFWSAPVDEPAIYRHLRTLNLADIPPEEGRSKGLVLFRHWDPSVMALVLPVLEPAQRVQLFGPANAITVTAPEGILTTTKRTDWPIAARGRLRLSAAQISVIADAMTQRSRWAIAAYLRETAKLFVDPMDDVVLLAFVTSSESIARTWGITTEAGFGRFAWLMLATGDALEEMDSIREWLTAGDAKPDTKLRTLMSVTAERLSAQEPP